MTTTETLTYKTTDLYNHSQTSTTPSPLPQIPANFPLSKLIPKTRFIIDGFRNAGDFSLSYFLSHFHSDHYSGLSQSWSRGVIYCSSITARLVVETLGVSKRFVVDLPVNETVLIDDCEVTLIDANHCPGAVQFLFRVPVNGEFERFVHTGDFRFCNDMKFVPVLNDFVGCDGVFLDTTYCDPKFVFPKQEESIDYVVSVIEKVKSESKSKKVLFLVATYVIGKEKILLEIARRCGCRIYVDGRKMGVLRALGYENEGVFTKDESGSDVHVVGWNVLGETWPYFRPNFVKMKEIMVEKGYSKVVGFVPTGWTYEVKRNKFAVRVKDSFEIHLVPYSEHSNYNELREYVKFLKPKRVIPTVGSDVENVDSKHAAKMRKHFAGLVDEMANKQEFLMGFYRVPQEKGMVKRDDLVIELDKEVEQLEECDPCDIKQDHNTCSSSGSICSVAFKDEPGSQDIASFSHKEKDEIMQELQDCLPTWVSENIMLELVKSFGRNIVDAVSHFYEHETVFHERSGKPLSSSQSNPTSNDTNLLNPTHGESSVQTQVKPPNQGLKFQPSKQPVVKSGSPGKRKKISDNKPNKRGKVNSNLEAGGIKQCTITKFFSKSSSVSQGMTAPLSEISTDDGKSSCGLSSIKRYEEEIKQFIQIIDGDESMKGYSADLIEKARGNVELALDMHYRNNEAQVSSHQKSLDFSSKPVSCEGLDASTSIQGKECSGPSDKVFKSVHVSVAENVAATFVSLPPEKYSPVEHACWKQGQPAPYIHLARTFDLVECEKGKIKATSMLCNMFRSLLALSPDDVLPAVYLCTNKIAADHENMELNIGGSLVASAIEEACGTNRAKIREMYNNLGDLGDVAQECRQTQSLLLPPPPLLVRDVYSVLRKISVQTGTGSTDRRKSLIVGMMRSCREKEMKFIVRTLVRNLRIGAMMRTVLPALAQAVALNCGDESTDKNLKELLQSLSAAAIEAYNILPDLSLLVPSLMSEGIKFSTSTLTMVPGIPIKPMLAKITNGTSQVLKLFQNKAFTCEYKYDGQRAQIHKLNDGSVRIFSRNGDETTSRFPDLKHIIQQSCKSSAGSFVIDAEVIGIDRKNGNKFLSFQELSARERGSKASLISLDRIKVDICVLVFDAMFVNGEKLLACPLRQRRQCMKDLFNGENPGFFEYAKEITIEADESFTDSEETLTKINAFLEDAYKSSCEGIMVKLLDVDAGYFASKRADSWLKVKRDYIDGVGDSLDLVPIGAWHGNGRKAGWYSPFLMACYNPDSEEFESLCRVMTGFSDSFYKEMKEIFSGDKILTKKPLYYRTDEAPDIWFSAEIVWEIKGADLTVSPVHKAAVGIVHPSRGISMRFPRFICSRSDKRPEDCSTSTDVAEMFHSQTRKMDVSGLH